jgi:hypothetical protein
VGSGVFVLAWISDHQTILVAVYGAVVATAVAVWNIYRTITDRGQLRVMVTRADAVSPGLGNIWKDRLWYKVTNVGRQPIYLTHIGGGYARGKHFVIATTEPLPKKLEPGESFNDASSDAKELATKSVTFLGAWDSLNGVHKLPKKELKALLKDVKGGEA